MKIRFISMIILAGILVTGCSYWGGVRGNGKIKSETRKITEFNKIEASGAYSIKVVVGEQPSIKIKAEENLLPLIRTYVKGKRLIIDNKKNLSPRKELLIEITTNELISIECSGANDITVNGIDTDRFEVDLSGAGSIELNGESDQFYGDLSGAGNINARNLISNKVYISVSGAASASVYAKEFLDASVSGVGSIEYFGDPKETKSNVSGIGSITRK